MAKWYHMIIAKETDLEEKGDPVYPCRNCLYFQICGDNMRTAPCKGRETKTSRREYISRKQGSAPPGWVCIGVCGYHEDP